MNQKAKFTLAYTHLHTHTHKHKRCPSPPSRDYQMVRLQASRWCGRDLASNSGRASSAKNLTESEIEWKESQEERGRETETEGGRLSTEINALTAMWDSPGDWKPPWACMPRLATHPARARQAQCSALLQGHHLRKSRWKLHRGKQDSERSTLAKLQQRRSLKRGAGKSSLPKVLLL